MSREKRLARQEEEQRKRDDAEFEARYAAKTEAKNVEKYIKTISDSIEKLMSKAVEAKKLGLEKSFVQLATQVKVLKLRQKQAQSFMFQYDIMLDMKDISKASTTFMQSMNVIMESLGGMNFAKEEMEASRKILAKSNSNLEKQTMMIDNVLETFDSVGFGEEADSNGSGLDISDVENEVFARMGAASNTNSAETNVVPKVNDEQKAQKDIEEIKRKLNTY